MIIDKGNKMAVTTRDGRVVPLRLKINPRARRFILRIDEKAREAVAITPHRSRINEVLGFAQERADWLSEQLSNLPDIKRIADGSEILLRGEPCQVTLNGAGHRVTLSEGPPLTLRAPGDARTVSARVERYLRRLARADLTEAVARHSAALGVQASAISVKDTRSRWGSCTSNGRLSFSWRLILAPPEVLDYVAAHECAHLLEMNHSSAFWAHVAACCPDWKRYRGWLKRHGQSLHAIGGS